MIPVPLHFTNITREAALHQGVAAEIEAARGRAGVEGGRRPRTIAGSLRLILAMVRPRRGARSRLPAQ